MKYSELYSEYVFSEREQAYSNSVSTSYGYSGKLQLDFYYVKLLLPLLAKILQYQVFF